MTAASQFFQAVQAGDENIVKALLAADPALASAKNERGHSAILAAIYTGRNAVRDLLLAHGVVLELHEAAAAGEMERVKELLEKDAALAKSYSPDGFPVFALAAVFGHFPVVQYLFAKGAEVNAVATNGTGYTALTGAVTSGHKEIVAWLLSKGANANYRYGPGYTPVHAAAANGQAEIMKLLLEHGADLHTKTSDGQTALSLAEARGHKEVAELLRAGGAA
jgi:ankyrin repeat protein